MTLARLTKIQITIRTKMKIPRKIIIVEEGPGTANFQQRLMMENRKSYFSALRTKIKNKAKKKISSLIRTIARTMMRKC